VSCHSPAEMGIEIGIGSIALIGQPNVGKSALFQRLTGQRVVISNYPGTTVEIARGTASTLDGSQVVDTPGIIALPASSDDERVTEQVLLHEPLRALLQVGDAKNLRRTLLLTCQLAEMGLPLVLALNMTDEAQALGVQVDYEVVAQAFGLQVVPTTAVRGAGLTELLQAVRRADSVQFQPTYSSEVEDAIQRFEALARNVSIEAPISLRSLALLFLGGDPVAEAWLQDRLEPDILHKLIQMRLAAEEANEVSLEERIQSERLQLVERIESAALLAAGKAQSGVGAILGHLTTHPLWGWAILGLVLYGMYWFVGVLGAGVLVGYLENDIFSQWLNPRVTSLVQQIFHQPWMVDLLVGPYGLWTMGMTYAIALILPIVTTFFLAFGVMEDSGYLPRLAALSNRLFQKLGLNGKAVLPMVLGLGCVTMATLTTRVLESRRERLLATLLLALAVPCSAQLGVVMGMLAGISFSATLIWSAVVVGVMFAIGWLAARLIPGERTLLLVELPPMRRPQFSNVMIKTLARLEWYAKEVLPLFLIGSFLMFLLNLSGILSWITRAGEPLVTGWLGLPAEASATFLMGFLRRDFGATGLFMMQTHGLLSPIQVVVAMVTITLFIPCIASVMMIAKERSLGTALGMMGVVFPLALIVGGLLYRVLLLFRWAG
jgi:ferrous iron transport protein B